MERIRARLFSIHSCMENKLLNYNRSHIFRLTFNKDTGKHTSTETLNNLSGLGSIASRLTELKKNYLKQAQETQNPLICPLIEEYISSRSEIEREGSSPSILTGVEKITLYNIVHYKLIIKLFILF